MRQAQTEGGENDGPFTGAAVPKFPRVGIGQSGMQIEGGSGFLAIVLTEQVSSRRYLATLVLSSCMFFAAVEAALPFCSSGASGSET
jgi:hypothetical protein